MIIKAHANQKIVIRQLTNSDNKIIKQSQCFMSPLQKPKQWLEVRIKKIKDKKAVFLVAEHNNAIVGMSEINLRAGQQSHVGECGVCIEKNYRGIGLGTSLMEEIIKLAKKNLKPRPKVLRCSTSSANQQAIKLVHKLGFKIIANIPNQIRHKNKLVDEIIMILYL